MGNKLANLKAGLKNMATTTKRGLSQAGHSLQVGAKKTYPLYS